MSDFVVIHKQDLKTLAQDTPDKDGLLRVLETKFDPDPKNKYKFLVMPSNTAKHPAAYAVDESMDWQLLHTVGNFIGKLCPHLPLEEQTRIINRLHGELSRKFACAVHTLKEAFAAILSKTCKIIEDESRDSKQAAGFEPESVEVFIKALWQQCEKGMQKIVGEDEKKESHR